MKDNRKLLGWTCSLLNLVDFECHFYQTVVTPLFLSFKDFFFPYIDKYGKDMKYLKYFFQYQNIKIYDILTLHG